MSIIESFKREIIISDQRGYNDLCCSGRVEYEQRQGWVVTGIIAGTMLPLIVCIGLVYLCYFHDNSEKRSSVSWKYFQNRSTYRKSPQSSLLSSQPKSDDSENSPPRSNKHRRQYDKVYRTHEPIPGKPLVDFSDREENLKDVDDGEVKRFRDSCYYGSESASKSGSFVSAEGGANGLGSILESSPESSQQETKNNKEMSSETETSDEETRPNVESNAFSSDSREGSESDDGPKYEKIENKSTSSSSPSRSKVGSLRTGSRSGSRKSGSSRSGKSSPDRTRYSKASTSRPKSSTSSSERPKISTSSYASSKGSAIQTPI